MTTLRRFWRVLAAGVITGLAIWFTRASLDLFSGAGRATRVAMLPSGLELAGLVLIVSAGFAGAAALVWRRRGGITEHADVQQTVDWLVPLFALSALSLPYLPWLADRLPILIVLAGPLKYLAWTAVVLQVVWAVYDARTSQRRIVDHRGGAVFVFVIAFAVFGAAAWRLTGSGPFPGGDEPHYLVIAQSLWRDHDLKIENNHTRRDYEEYFHAPLPPHYQARGADGAIYSIHPIGLPVVLAPVYALLRYRGVVLFLAALGALTSALMWQWARRETESPLAATFAWAAIALSAPYLFGSFVVYPEMMAALCVIAAFSVARSETGLGQWTIAALAIAALPWLSTKYTPMALSLTAVCLFRAWRAGAAWRTRAGVLAGTLAISLFAWLLFFALIWGSPLPSAPYGGTSQMQLQYLAKGAPGLLFDQEYGVIAYAPVLLLGFTGLWTMWRSGRAGRMTVIEIAVVFVPLWVTVSAYELWWGGASTPGRPLVAGLPLLALPIAWQHAGAAAMARRAAHGLLLVASIWITATLVLAQKGLLVALGHTGTSPLLVWLSPNWRLWALAPSVFYHPLSIAAAFVFVWLVVAIGSRLVLDRQPARRPGAAALVATMTAGGALLVLSVLLPGMFGSRLQPEVSLEGRARIDILDDFDSDRRPTAVVYDPFRRVSSAEVPALFTLEAAPGRRAGRQPLELLFNRRFALAAGRYRVEITPAPQSHEAVGELTLQIGRASGPMTRWEVRLRPGQTWRQEFWLPIDAGFVGFVGSSPIREAASSIRVRPVAIVDRHKRLSIEDEVLGAASFGPTSVYVHEDIWLEPTGFWTRGGTTVSLVLAPSRPGSVVLKVRSARPNAVVLEAGNWRRELTLAAGVDQVVEVPASPRDDHLVALRVTTSEGFTPAVDQPGNPDRRFLGCWIEIDGK